jgi:hypothetical protein
MAPGHERGFGYLSNVAIDQHVRERGRENELSVVVAAHLACLALASMKAHAAQRDDRDPTRRRADHRRRRTRRRAVLCTHRGDLSSVRYIARLSPAA